MIGIKKITPFFSGQYTTISALKDVDNLDSEQRSYYESIGIDGLYADDNFTSYQLACEASRKLLIETGISGDQIDLVIFIRSRLPDTLISSEATRLQYDIQANRAQSFTLSDLGCTDMSMAIKIGHDFLIANARAEHVLIVHGCKPFSPHRYRHPVTITGDGGVAVLLGRNETCKIQGFTMETNGKYWDLFKMEYKELTFNQYREECSDMRKYAFELALESKNRFTDLNNDLLRSHALTKDDIQHYLLQNVSCRAFEYYETAFEVAVSPVCQLNLSRYGHLGPNDIMVNLHTGITEGLFQEGDRVLIMNNSPVAAWSSLLIQI